jgi:hypothetical protein
MPAPGETALTVAVNVIVWPFEFDQTTAQSSQPTTD